jgi:hypothetical protein
MGLEAATHINQLSSSNPLGADPKSQGDDHIRLVKAVLVTDFANIGGAVTASHTELNYLVGVTSAIQTQLNGKAASSHTHGNGDLTGYTAADVLAKLLTVDGAGSGLDADLLDGQSSAFYQNAGNLNAGSVPDARIAQSSVTQHEAAIGTDAATVSRVVRRNSSGYIFASYLNQSSADSENPTIGQFIVRNASADGYNRAASVSHANRALNLSSSVTIQADPGGTPSGSPGDEFWYY